MAEWSLLTNGSVLDLAETSDANPINGGSVGSGIEFVKDSVECDHKGTDIVKDGVECVNGDDDDYKGRLRCTFDQVLSVFIKEIGDRGVVRPVPAIFGDRQHVDLFKLYCVVRDKGGYDLVSKRRLWSHVSKELGLDNGATAASVKLIYFKYLNELEIWFRESCTGRSLGNGESGRYGTFHLMSVELETEFRGLLLDGTEQKDNGDGLVHLESDRNGKIEYGLSDTKDACTMHSGTGTGNGHDDEKACHDDQNGTFVLPSRVDSKENERKRKRRESLSGMLNWVIQTATQLGDVSIGEIPEPAKWKKHQGNEFWFQAIKAREALMVRRDINPKTEELLQQKKLRMHPLMYEDNIAAGHLFSERLRCRGRLPHSTKSRSCTCCNSSPPTQSNLISPSMEEPKEQEPMEVDLASPHTSVIPSDQDEFREKYVSIGPLFQADVPEWTGEASESDDKWLGTRVWPLECEENASLVKKDTIGRGRPHFCGCRLPGSVTCLRFHIAEARMKLKKELGSLFYHWRFDRMGEEICLQWTAEEEKRFKILVQSKYPFFWNSASKWFPRKTRENLVSYYFNVFLVRRRSYQNRATPKNIDSDDDETDFGSLSEGFGHEAVKVAGSSFVACSQNKQCDILD
ncbi:PREDICTED: AT-rich interactive domain-containing protein 2-like [Fragaria vesca subsp. vesca]|uniref:AT-rich interactive domain-containing protein 2-like n=1 Tax=Fragaria vesca subsp. vesca TaxID=101020 RepID=UPI0002C328EC|nr:PREDICTED: AT-rich interactive domain-containing protein 2-like [Fragaria vesca subsp. vesca]